MNTSTKSSASDRRRAVNVRTALILAAIAATFFFGVIAARYLGDLETGMSVLGFVVFLLLIFAIGRNVRDR